MHSMIQSNVKTYTHTKKKKTSKGRRDDLADNSTGCSYRGSGFKSEHLLRGLHLCKSGSTLSDAVFWLLWAQGIHVAHKHTWSQNKHTHMHKNKLRIIWHAVETNE